MKPAELLDHCLHEIQKVLEDNLDPEVATVCLVIPEWITYYREGNKVWLLPGSPAGSVFLELGNGYLHVFFNAVEMAGYLMEVIWDAKFSLYKVKK